MRYVLLFFLVLVAGLLIVASTPACPPLYVRKAVAVVKDVVVEKVLVLVPTFSVAYQPYVAPAPADGAVLSELRRISQRLDSIERVRPVAPAQAPTGPSGPQSAAPAARSFAALGVYTAKCAACHQAGNEDRGGGFTLLDTAGQRVALEPRQSMKVMSQAYAGRMPPKSNKAGIGPLSDEEVSLIMADLGK